MSRVQEPGNKILNLSSEAFLKNLFKVVLTSGKSNLPMGNVDLCHQKFITDSRLITDGPKLIINNAQPLFYSSKYTRFTLWEIPVMIS